MRLDRFLKVSRLIKRRTVAQDACQAGRVRVNGRLAKPAAEVRAGDVIAVQFGAKTIEVEVVDPRENATAEQAAGMYRVIRETGPGISSSDEHTY